MPDLSTVVNMFFGADNNKVLYALIILVTLDYITGVCVAIKDKKLSSSIGAKGIINKVVIFIMVSLSHVVDSYLLSSGVALERITILFYCANEAKSLAISFPLLFNRYLALSRYCVLESSEFQTWSRQNKFSRLIMSSSSES